MGKLKTLTGYATFIGLIAMWLLLFACKDDEVGGKPFDPSLPVTINSIVPDSGGIATPIVIKGHNFGMDKSKVQVFFDDREAVVVNVVDEFIYAMVPRCPGGETTIKVVMDSTYEATLEGQTFNYIVSARVTSVATDYTVDMSTMLAVATDDDENLAVCEGYSVSLYSGADNQMATILQNMYYFQDVCFSTDKQYLYAMPQDPMEALLVIMDKGKNWERQVVFANDDITNDLYYSYSMAVGTDGSIYIYGPGEVGGRIYRIDPESRVATKLGEIALETGQSLAYNPSDGYLYLSVSGMGEIIRFPAKEGLTQADVETVIGSSGTQIIETGEVPGYINGIDFDQDNNLYATVINEGDYESYIYQLDMTTKEATPLTGGRIDEDGVDGTLAQARFYWPVDLTVNTEGFIYVMEYRESHNQWITPVNRLRCIAIQ